jgi:hypothetical protein
VDRALLMMSDDRDCREAEEKPSVSAADADTRTRKTANTTASDTLSTPPPVTAAEAAPSAKNFVCEIPFPAFRGKCVLLYNNGFVL